MLPLHRSYSEPADSSSTGTIPEFHDIVAPACTPLPQRAQPPQPPLPHRATGPQSPLPGRHYCICPAFDAGKPQCIFASTLLGVGDGIHSSLLCLLSPARRVPLHPFNRPSTQRSNARCPTLRHVSVRDDVPCTSPSCFIPLPSACARTPVSRQPTESSLLKLRRTPHTAWHLEPACSAIATRREHPRSSGMCMAPVLGSGSGALCFAEAQCARCLCAG